MELITDLIDHTFSSRVHLALTRLESGQPEHILTDEEGDELRTISNNLRRREYLSSRSLVKQLGDHAGINPQRMQLRKDKLGKPYGRYQSEHIYISIAHTQAQVLCALSRQIDIGVDIEPVNREVSNRLRSRIEHPAEVVNLRDLSSVQLWTIKEATVKLLGCGLRLNLNELIVRPDTEHGYLVRFNDEKTVRICSFQHKECWISVASYI